MTLLLLLLTACSGPTYEFVTVEPPPAPVCGDGSVDPFEACDAGVANGEAADACRTDCTLPRCGDAIVDSGEDCDDGNALGGDGCAPTCIDEVEPIESEPNSVPLQANALTPGAWVRGGADAGDVDCFFVTVPEQGWIDAELRGADGADCPAAMITWHDAWGARIAQATPGTDECPRIDPSRDPNAAFLAEGTWIACVEGLYGAAVPAYDLRIQVNDDSCALTTLPVDPRGDPDGDGLLDRCDADDDGDGVLDVDDNCPLSPNGPDMGPLLPNDSGFLRYWLTIGEWYGLESTLDCRPSLDNVLGDDATAAPHLGDQVDGLTWLPWLTSGRRITFLERYGGDVPREVYAVTWINSPIEQDVVLAAGVDDGFFAWLNGELVDDVSGCQGTNVDQFQSQVTLTQGWNRLMIKVRDQGGGWGMFVRFLDGAGAPITDLELSITPDGPWIDLQGDLDGDGVGDVCDETPAG